jgi:hypothetical protein
VERLEEQVKGLDEELKAIKKLKSKPKIKASTLNQEKKTPQEGEKRAWSEKRSKKTSFVPDEERLIEPEDLPEGATFSRSKSYWSRLQGSREQGERERIIDKIGIK